MSIELTGSQLIELSRILGSEGQRPGGRFNLRKASDGGVILVVAQNGLVQGEWHIPRVGPCVWMP